MTGEELRKHDKPSDCWVAIDGNVYDLSGFIASHPGGADVLLRYAGQDASAAFHQMHPDAFLNMLPAGSIVGTLDSAKPPKRVGPKPAEPAAAAKMPLDQHLNVDDFAKTAEKTMDRAGWVYYTSAAEDELTLFQNQNAFRQWWFRPHVLVDVSRIDTTTSVLGKPSSFPLFISASAMAGLAHPDAEVALARAAYTTGVIQMVPTISSRPIEEIAAARGRGQSQFFQLYANRDRSKVEALVKKAETLGFSGLFLTVDTPLIGRRERDIRNKFAAGQGVITSLGTISDPSLTWNYIAWLKSITKMPLVLKGVQRADDAIKAAQYGVAGLLLSNHGGRQLDGARASLDVLVEVREAIGRDSPMELYMDGGIRRGSDIVKAIALGARAVGVSRAVLYGLASYGQEGAERVLKLLHDEFELCMALNGAVSVDRIDRDMVVRG